MLAALLLVLVRTLAMFELTFLTAGPTSQTLVGLKVNIQLRASRITGSRRRS